MLYIIVIYNYGVNNSKKYVKVICQNMSLFLGSKCKSLNNHETQRELSNSY